MIEALKNVSVFGWIVSASLVLIGWWVIYRNAKKLATRNETKSLIDSTISTIDTLESISLDYWLASRKERIDTDVYESKILAKIISLNNKLSLLNQRKLTVSSNALANLHSKLLLNDEQADRMSKEDKQLRVNEILESTRCIEIELYNAFHAAYKPTHALTLTNSLG